MIKTYKYTTQIVNTTVSNNSTYVLNLDPGTGYNISVTTITADQSASTDVWTFSYTSKTFHLHFHQTTGTLIGSVNFK